MDTVRFLSPHGPFAAATFLLRTRCSWRLYPSPPILSRSGDAGIPGSPLAAGARQGYTGFMKPQSLDQDVLEKFLSAMTAEECEGERIETTIRYSPAPRRNWQ